MPGPSGCRSSSNSANVSRAAENPTGATAAYAVGRVGAQLRARVDDRAPPVLGVLLGPTRLRGASVAIGARAIATSSSSSQSAAFVALVPRSRVRTASGHSPASAADDLGQRGEVLAAVARRARGAEDLADEPGREQRRAGRARRSRSRGRGPWP